MNDFKKTLVLKNGKKLVQLPSYDQSWERYETECDWERDDADFLGCPFTRSGALTMKNESMYDPEDTEKILWEFPKIKLDLEKSIQELYNMADKIDKIHKNCTIAKVVADSTAVLSGFLTTLGIVFSPVTSEGSTTLFAAGSMLEKAATFTRISATVVDNMYNSQGRKLLDHKTSTNPGKSLCEDTAKIFQKIKKSVEVMSCLEQMYDIFMNSASQKHKKGGRVSTKNTQKNTTALTMTKGDTIKKVVSSGCCVLIDVENTVEDSIHLLNGAESITAAELREKAQYLEKELGRKLLKMETQYSIPLAEKW